MPLKIYNAYHAFKVDAVFPFSAYVLMHKRFYLFFFSFIFCSCFLHWTSMFVCDLLSWPDVFFLFFNSKLPNGIQWANSKTRNNNKTKAEEINSVSNDKFFFFFFVKINVKIWNMQFIAAEEIGGITFTFFITFLFKKKEEISKLICFCVSLHLAFVCTERMFFFFYEWTSIGCNLHMWTKRISFSPYRCQIECNSCILSVIGPCTMLHFIFGKKKKIQNSFKNIFSSH